MVREAAATTGMFVAALVANVAPILMRLQVPGTRWNWTGKLAEAAVAAIVAARLSPEEAGLVRPRRHPALALLPLLPLATLAGRLGGFAHATTGAESVLFQLLAAPLAEELSYRGAMQGLARRAGPSLGIVLPALFFGGVHMVRWQGWSPSVDWSQGDLLLWGLALGYVREKTGSLWPGAAAHAAANLVTAIP